MAFLFLESSSEKYIFTASRIPNSSTSSSEIFEVICGAINMLNIISCIGMHLIYLNS